MFAHDYLRFWETVYGQKLRCDKSNSPQKKCSTNPVSPKVNRRYAYRSDGFGGDEININNERTSRITFENNYGA